MPKQSKQGILLRGAVKTLIRRSNCIGLDASGLQALGNGLEGILIEQATMGTTFKCDSKCSMPTDPHNAGPRNDAALAVSLRRAQDGDGEVPAAERKAMLRDPNFWRLYQAGHIGPQYFCFACMNVCPVGRATA